MMKIAVLLTLMISLTVVANLLMKLGAAEQRSVMLLRVISWRIRARAGDIRGRSCGVLAGVAYSAAECCTVLYSCTIHCCNSRFDDRSW
jgi:hypothetical protein